ncbi:hypothetical protein NDU88_003341 [Pleurodeles waltl]|uniref:Uncharacterized protein n=1 Tax=Pleurodeles waltl TaxID=8319 RepID=A0AAV7W4Q1_PLEWA|nr:hypothetical protein NDU88_003341 [Pleurodeles waltl]
MAPLLAGLEEMGEDGWLMDSIPNRDGQGPAPEWKYPGGISASRDAVSEEAEPHWNGSLQDDPELVGILNPVHNGVQERTAGEGGFRGTAVCVDREAEMAGEGDFRGTTACVGKETADADESF